MRALVVELGQVRPAPAVTVRGPGSNANSFIGPRSIIRPPSVTARPATLWPPPRTESSRSAPRVERECVDDVGRRPTPRDQRRTLVHDAIVDRAGIVVSRLVRREDGTGEPIAGEVLLERCAHDHTFLPEDNRTVVRTIESTTGRANLSRTMARRRRRDGEDSRNAILGAAARLATVEGIEGLSISRLADEVGMSKSGLFAHFGSKEELQLATVETASAIFAAQVTAPAATAPTGSERLRRLIDGYLRYTRGRDVSRRVLLRLRPGGGRACGRAPFATAWSSSSAIGSERLEAAVRAAQAEGAIDPAEDPAQLTFEIEAALFLANTQYVVAREAAPLERARRAIERRLERPS